MIWDSVSGLLRDPGRLERGLEALIEGQGEGSAGDPSEEIAAHEARLAEGDRLRRAYQDQQAAGLMTLEELRSRLGELDGARRAAEAAISALERSRERSEGLGRDKEAALAALTEIVPGELDNLGGEQRNAVYRMLRLRVTPTPEGFDASGVLMYAGTHTVGCIRWHKAELEMGLESRLTGKRSRSWGSRLTLGSPTRAAGRP